MVCMAYICIYVCVQKGAASFLRSIKHTHIHMYMYTKHIYEYKEVLGYMCMRLFLNIVIKNNQNQKRFPRKGMQICLLLPFCIAAYGNTVKLHWSFCLVYLCTHSLSLSFPSSRSLSLHNVCMYMRATRPLRRRSHCFPVTCLLRSVLVVRFFGCVCLEPVQGLPKKKKK